MMRRSQITKRPGLLDTIAESPDYPKMLRVTINGALKFSHGQINSADIANLASLLKTIAHLFD